MYAIQSRLVGIAQFLRDLAPILSDSCSHKILRINDLCISVSSMSGLAWLLRYIDCSTTGLVEKRFTTGTLEHVRQSLGPQVERLPEQTFDLADSGRL